MLVACALGGAAAGLAGMVEVAAVHGNANASLIAGYGYTGILVAFIARQNPLAIVPVAILLGGISAPAAACCSGASTCPTRRCRCCRASPSSDPGQRNAVRAASAIFRPRHPHGRAAGGAGKAAGMTELGWWGVPIAVLGGAMRVSTPFLFVSLGECITEKAAASTSASKASW